MVKRIFKMLFADFHWKLLALVAASVLWFIGMNLNDPYQNHTVSPRLHLHNIGIIARDGLVLLNEDALRDANVQITLRALRSDMDILRAAIPDSERFVEMVEVSVDFRAVDVDAVAVADGIVAQQLRITPNLATGFEPHSITPSYIEVLLDAAERSILPVEISRQGDVPPGFELQYIHLANERVTVSGPRTVLREVHSVLVDVDITGVHEDAELSVPLRVISHEGEDITGQVHLSVWETTADLRVWPVREIDVIVQLAGEAAPGFAGAEIENEPEAIEVVGPAEALGDLEYIIVEIDLGGAASNIIRYEHISDWLPEGIELSRGMSAFLGVSVAIEPIEERILQLSRDDVLTRGTALYQILDDDLPIEVTVSGPRSLIAALTAANIELELDLRTLQIGQHTVPLYVGLPEGLTIAAAAPRLMVQIHEPAVPDNDYGYTDIFTPATPDTNELYDDYTDEPEYYENDYDPYYYEYPDDYPQGADDDYGEEYPGEDSEL